MLYHTAPQHMAVGGSIFLGYELIIEFMRHHDESNLRPMIIDHLIAMSLIGTVGGWMATNTIRGAFQGFLFFGLNIGFLSYWAMKMGLRPGAGEAPVLIYYDTDVTKEEKERFEMQDQLNILAFNMCTKPAYGLADVTQKYEM
jgi:hypothetical protein